MEIGTRDGTDEYGKREERMAVDKAIDVSDHCPPPFALLVLIVGPFSVPRRRSLVRK